MPVCDTANVPTEVVKVSVKIQALVVTASMALRPANVTTPVVPLKATGVVPPNVQVVVPLLAVIATPTLPV